MKRHLAFVAGAGAVSLFGAAHAVYAQVLPGDIDRSQFRASAHALGMGGSDLLLNDGIDSAAANPAAIGDSGKFSFGLSAEARTDNVKWSDINDVVDNVTKVRDQIDNTTGGISTGQVTAAYDAFDSIYNFAIKAGAQPNGGPATLKAVGAPSLGFSFGKFGVIAYGGVAVNLKLSAGTGTGPGLGLGLIPTGVVRPSAVQIGDKRKVSVDGGLLAMSTVAVPIAVPIAVGVIGVSPKFVRADYGALSYTADASNNLISGTNYNSVSDQKLDVDLGFQSKSFLGVRYAAVVRNLLQPKFNLKRRVGGHDQAGDFNFTNSTEFDLGAMYTKENASYVVEEHNLSGANGANSTFHLGGEYRVGPVFALRAGYDDDRFVAGLGFNLHGTRFDIASSSDPDQRIAASVTGKF
ncbi:hypothetical protein CCAX7_45300 [Capsulimonas corticalis]|uniref:Uncharacterized protein n=1 Tax=Capsulimonas corticalis TaxID=2219043 RepID=A0A402D6F5_9BACT|nr:conjugal transfer protein TraF [Capsulimonas corticalis]BDI32479.1 hypothetical protein CCAX7_45300 [Capsulimonas corticalis]